MKILLNIPDEVVGKCQFEADKEKRSRKNLMEKVLIDYFEQPKVAIEDLNKQTGKKSLSDPPPTTNHTVDNIPVKKPGENAFDFAARKNEWKRKQK